MKAGRTSEHVGQGLDAKCRKRRHGMSKNNPAMIPAFISQATAKMQDALQIHPLAACEPPLALTVEVLPRRTRFARHHAPADPSGRRARYVDRDVTA